MSEKTNVRVYLEHKLNYIVILTEYDYEAYEMDFFKTRKAAERFNEEKLHNMGDVMTTRQAVRKYDFIIED